MQNTRSVEAVGDALIDLMAFFASPRRDQALMREAGVSLDRALFPLLVRLADGSAKGVTALGDEVGRDQTTVSRQLAKLEALGFVIRAGDAQDRRIRAAQITPAGADMVQAIAAARTRLLSRVLADWPEADRAALGALTGRFVEALNRAANRG